MNLFSPGHLSTGYTEFLPAYMHVSEAGTKRDEHCSTGT